VSGSSTAECFVKWARGEPTILALVQIGSRVRAINDVDAADAFSDWDFQVVTSRQALFKTRQWLLTAGVGKPLAYSNRMGRLGRGMKVSVVFPDGEIDLVLLPAGRLRAAKWAIATGVISYLRGACSALGDLGLFLRPGFRMLKGAESWGAFFQHVATEIPQPRLDNAAVIALTEGFVCDYISICRKIARGEMLAAQRWLHLQLAETNFRLLHELRLRRLRTSFPDARRIERLVDLKVADVSISAYPSAESLSNAVEKCARTCRILVTELLENEWRWPNLTSARFGGSEANDLL